MEINITKKYAKDFLDGKAQKYFKTTDEGTFFTGSVKFRLFDTNNYFSKVEISFWLPDAKEPIFIAKEEFHVNEDNVFTFEPFTAQIG